MQSLCGVQYYDNISSRYEVEESFNTHAHSTCRDDSRQCYRLPPHQSAMLLLTIGFRRGDIKVTFMIAYWGMKDAQSLRLQCTSSMIIRQLVLQQAGTVTAEAGRQHPSHDRGGHRMSITYGEDITTRTKQ